MARGSGLDKMSVRLERFPDEVVRKGVKQLRAPIMQAITRASGGDRRLSGLRNKGQFNVRTKVTGTTAVEGHVTASPARMRGSWVWMDTGTKAGIRRTRGGSKRSYSFRHPGTRGKGAWIKPVESELPKVRKDIEQAFKATVRGR